MFDGLPRIEQFPIAITILLLFLISLIFSSSSFVEIAPSTIAISTFPS
jgi:hypothetical protein